MGHEMTRVGTRSKRHEMTEARDDSRGYEVTRVGDDLGPRCPGTNCYIRVIIT